MINEKGGVTLEKMIFSLNDQGFVLENSVISEKFASYRVTEAGYEWEARVGEKTAAGTTEYAADARDAIALHLRCLSAQDLSARCIGSRFPAI